MSDSSSGSASSSSSHSLPPGGSSSSRSSSSGGPWNPSASGGSSGSPSSSSASPSSSSSSSPSSSSSSSLSSSSLSSGSSGPGIPTTPPICDACQDCTQSQVSGDIAALASLHPVRYFNGELRLQATDLAFANFGLPWGHARSFSNTLGGAVGGVNGNNWLLKNLPQLIPDAGGNLAAAVGPQVYWFATSAGGTIAAPLYPFKSTLTRDSSLPQPRWVLQADNSGRLLKFELDGRFVSAVSAGGDEMLAGYDSLGRLATMTLSSAAAAGTVALYTYAYAASGASAYRLASITYQVGPTAAPANVRRVDYTYYAAGDGGGNAGDLRSAAVSAYDATAGAWAAIAVSFYRYYRAGDANGYLGGLKYSVGPQAYANLAAAVPDPLNATDAQVAAYADLYVEYDAQRRVTREVTAGGAYAYGFSYFASFHPAGVNSWAMRTTETLPDGSQNAVYSSAFGQTLLKVFRAAGGQEWCDYFLYDDATRACILRAEPSAVSGYDETHPDVGVSLKTNAGLIHGFVYYPDPAGSGGAPGYLKSESVQQGSGGTPVKLYSLEYASRTVNGQTVYPVSKRTLYQSDAAGGSDPAETGYAYTWPSNSLQPSQVVTTLPVVPTTQNGSGVADSRAEVYDRYGNVTWTKDERGYIGFMAYDANTGTVTQRIVDAQTSGMSGVPAGWATPTGGGLNLVSDYEFDLLGRTTQELGPVHTIDLSGTATVIRRATWMVYLDLSNQMWTGQGYATGSAPSYTFTLVNPVTLAQMDKAGRMVDQRQAARASASGKLQASDSFPQTSWSRWTHASYDAHGHQTARRVYFLIPTPSGDGAKDVNYNESVSGYDASGWQNKQVTPGGTITRTTFHPRGWPLQTWVGTNDAGATDQDPSGGGAPGNNMVKVSANEYDGGAAGGDGNLTKLSRFTDAAGTLRATGYGYDFRDRRTSETPAGAGFRDVYGYDNQDRATQTDRTVSGTGQLLARNAARYDGHGRAYQTILYAVDQSTGTVGNALTGNNWYDPSGNVVKRLPAGASLFEKTVYDGAGRTTANYSAYNLTASGYPYPVSVSADTVLRQAESSFDAASNSITQTVRERNHDASGVGALQTPAGAQPQARVSYQARWPDALGRMAAGADYGTNGAAAWTRPTTAPTASAARLTTLNAYDSAGNLYQVTDAQGTITRATFDQAGRLTLTLNNYAPGGTNPDQNQQTSYAYNADGRVISLTAKNSATGDQATQFIYGVTLPGSDVASNDLLATKAYPLDASATPDRTTYAYNRQGEIKQSTDGNGTVHAYLYDALGRLQHDCVTTLGSGVNGAVRRVSRSYELHGMLQLATSYDNAAVGSGSEVNDVFLTYNSFGQLSADYQAHGGEVDPASTPKVQYAYADGSANTTRRTGLTYPDGQALGYGYGAPGSMADALSRLDSIGYTGGGTSPLATFTYLGLDTRVAMNYPQPAVQMTLIGTPGGDGGDQYVGLDRFGRLVDQRWVKGSADLERVQYGYNRASNRLWRHNPVALGAASSTPDEFYVNDSLQQLAIRQQGFLNAAKTGIAGTAAAEEDFTYDPTGNWSNYRTKAAGTIVVNQARTHNADNEITTLRGSGTLVGYDQAGNMTTMPQPGSWTAAYTLTWDAWNRLVKVQNGASAVATYAYDGLSRRVSKTAGGSVRHYYYSDQWKVLEERVDASTSAERQFVWRGCDEDKLILRETISGGSASRFYALDDGKNVTAACDASGGVQERYGFDGFGAPRFMDASFGARAASSYAWETLFCGYRFDADSQLYQVRYRYLHAQLGRWLSRDPIGEAERRQGPNLYWYVRNSPISSYDVLGLLEDPSGGYFDVIGDFAGWVCGQPKTVHYSEDSIESIRMCHSTVTQKLAEYVKKKMQANHVIGGRALQILREILVLEDCWAILITALQNLLDQPLERQVLLHAIVRLKLFLYGLSLRMSPALDRFFMVYGQTLGM